MEPSAMAMLDDKTILVGAYLYDRRFSATSNTVSRSGPTLPITILWCAYT